MKRKLRIKDVRAREARSDRQIARDIADGRFPAPHYDEAGQRFWWAHELDANDRRVEALKLGPKVRPPLPATKRTRHPKASHQHVAAE
jgi:hypothetical protein